MSRARTLSNRIEAIEYIHADDGKPYRHDFTSDGSKIILRADGTIAVKNKSRKLWDVFDVKGTEQPFLINPPAGRTTTKKRGAAMAKKRRRNRPMSAAQRKYFGPKRKRNPANPPRKRRRSVSAARRSSNPPNPPRKRRRRRNPMGFSVNSLLRRAQQGGMDALAIVAGRAGVRAISKQFPYPAGSVMDTVVEVGGALALGMVAERILGSDRGRFVLAGALSNSVEDLLASAKIPYVSDLLSGLPNANTAAVYASADQGLSRMGAWRQLAGWQGGRPTLQGADSLPVNSVAVYPA